MTQLLTQSEENNTNKNMNNVPELPKTNGQKTLNRNSLDDGPRIEAFSESLTENAVLDIMTEIDTTIDNVDRKNINQVKSKTNEFYVKCIKDYMKRRGITNFKSTYVIRLIPRNLDLSTLSFVAFKIIADGSNSERIQCADFWPSACKISRFVHRNPIATDLNESIIKPNNQMCDFL